MIKVQTDKAPKAIGPYSQAMITGNLVYTSGQIPLDPVSGGICGQTIEEQTHRVCKTWPLFWKKQALVLKVL